ncbi:MAG TPA: hypothetical protein VKY89_14650 [Thermoanaerobaculia bacterium]|nr:hypothetical protein [Thermoanaerobaculia bacterium]
MYLAQPVGNVAIFKQQLLHRLKALAQEFRRDQFVMPVGLILVIDKHNGGDVTAQELVDRFGVVDMESRNLIDFYFLGWHRTTTENRRDDQGDQETPAASRDDDSRPAIAFDLRAFEEFRTALRASGVGQFGGNADLILVDAHYAPGDISLDFAEAIRVDLSLSRAENDFPTLGAFLQALIEAAEQVRQDEALQDGGLVFAMSDKLGLAIAKKSLLDAFLEKFGKAFGAKRMAAVAVRKLGPVVRLREL